MAFEFAGVIYVPTCLTYGASMNVFYVQMINAIPCEFLRCKFNIWIILYIDDFLSQRRDILGVAVPELGIDALDSFPLLTLLLKLNFFIADHKTERDRSSLEFCGFFLDLHSKQISVKASTIEKMQKKISEGIIVDRNNNKFFFFDNLESILGIINFAASASEFGLSKTLELQLNFNSAKSSGANRIWVTPGMQTEIDYWAGLIPGDRMSLAKFACMHSVFYVDGIQPDLMFSDASSGKYGYKIHGESSLLSSGAGDFGINTEQKLRDLGVKLPPNTNLTKEIINSKEMIGSFFGVAKLRHNSFYLGLIDNFPVVAAIRKTRSKNRLSNLVLQAMFKLLKERNIFFMPVWINTKCMAIAGADDLSRADSSCLAETIKFSAKGINYFERFMPEPLTMVFGNIHDCTTYPNFDYASFHEEFDAKFIGIDPFQQLMKGLSEGGLSGTQIIFPPAVFLSKTIEILESSVHQKQCLFCLIVPASQLMPTKLRLQNKLNLRHSKFQYSHKQTKLNIKLRQDYFLIQYGSSLLTTKKFTPVGK